jgi:hypothetical protein
MVIEAGADVAGIGALPARDRRRRRAGDLLTLTDALLESELAVEWSRSVGTVVRR